MTVKSSMKSRLGQEMSYIKGLGEGWVRNTIERKLAHGKGKMKKRMKAHPLCHTICPCSKMDNIGETGRQDHTRVQDHQRPSMAESAPWHTTSVTTDTTW